MKFFCYPNFKSTACVTGEPWAWSEDYPAKITTKLKRQRWLGKVDTNWCLYSLFESDTGSTRPTQETAWCAHGLVVDFDKATPTDAEVATALAHCPKGLLPMWWHRTFSGGVRFVYEFAEAVRYFSQKFWSVFIRKLGAELKLGLLLAAHIDWPAMEDPKTIYDVGKNWVRVEGAAALPKNTVNSCILKAAEAGNLERGKLVELPWDFIEEKMKFFAEQGKWQAWQGQYRDGAHGTRFWDLSADNPTAAVLYSTGVLCFTGEARFIPWIDAKLLGDAARHFGADKIISAVRDIYYDGKQFWHPLQARNQTIWREESREDIKLFLNGEGGLDPVRRKDEVISELNRGLLRVVKENRIDYAGPFLYQTPGLQRWGNNTIINTATVRPLTPESSGGKAWGDGFPWLAAQIDDMFVSAMQKEYYFAWLHHFYSNALKGTPQNGHLLILAGEPKGGKTFHAMIVLPRIAGAASVDISRFLAGNSRFDDWMYDSPIWAINDPPPPEDYRRRQKLEDTLKAVVANDEFTVEGKFKKPIRVRYNGRAVLTCNVDADSIMSLPTFHDSTVDKFLLLRCRQAKNTRWGTREENHSTVNKELPHFCRWLLNSWVRHKSILPDARFGFVATQDVDLLREVRSLDPASKLVELMLLWFSATGDGELSEFVGTSSELRKNLDSIPELQGLAREWRADRIGRYLTKLMARSQRGVSKKIKRGVSVWTVRRAAIVDDVSRAGVDLEKNNHDLFNENEPF